MIKPFLAAMMLALSASFAMAAEDNDVTTKAMKDHPGTMGGSTAMTDGEAQLRQPF